MVLSSLNATNSTEEIELGEKILASYDKHLKFVYSNENVIQECPKNVTCIEPENKCHNSALNDTGTKLSVVAQEVKVDSIKVSPTLIATIGVLSTFLLLIVIIFLIKITKKNRVGPVNELANSNRG